MLKKILGNAQEDSGQCSRRFRGMLNKIPGNAQQDSGECSIKFREMLSKIPGNAQQDSGECSTKFQGILKKIPGNVQKDSGECSRRFRGMFQKIPWNAQEDSGECSKRFRRMFEKIPGNLNLDLLCEILPIFYQILQLNCVKTKEYFLCYYLLLITNLLRLNTVFLPPFSFLFSFSCRGKGVITVHRCRGIKKFYIILN